MNRLFPILALMLCLKSVCALAAVAPELNTNSQRIELTINVDGTYDEVVDRVIAITDDSALAQWRQLRLEYRTDVADAAVMYAELRKADGRKQELLKRAQEQGRSSPRSPTKGFIQFDLNALSIGDQIAFRLKLHHKAKLLGGEISLGYYLQTHLLTGDLTMLVRLPPNSHVHVEAEGFDAKQENTVNGQRQLVLSYRREKAEARDPDRIDQMLSSPHLFVSSFDDYAGMGRAIGRRFAKAITVTPALKTLASQIVGQAQEQRAKVSALYQWVTKHIVYDDNDIYSDGVSPRPAVDVLTRGRGDCKDHVVILATLLRAVGIESVPHLISTENNFTLLNIAIPHVFNHVIIYIPSLDSYADATNSLIPFGVLPQYEIGKPILSLDSRAVLAFTPQRTLWDANTVSTELVLSVDGALRGEVRSEARGALVDEMRKIARTFTPSNNANRVKMALTAGGLEAAQGTLTFSDDPAVAITKTYLTFSGAGAIGQVGLGHSFFLRMLRIVFHWQS